MRTVLLCSIAVLLGSTTHAKYIKNKEPHCKPAIYDAIYLRLVKERMEINLNKLITINREGVMFIDAGKGQEPEMFEFFRKLCYGQKSIYEKGTKYED